MGVGDFLEHLINLVLEATRVTKGQKIKFLIVFCTYT